MDDQPCSPDEILAEVGRVHRLTRGALADGSWRYLAVWSVVFLSLVFTLASGGAGFTLWL